ncbi:MAG: TrkA C-terminal domain-containing protein [Candidatus Manganitrophaceae bacterium]
MGAWKRIRRDITLATTGIQETTLAIAEQVYRRIESAKISLEMSQIEQQIKDREATFGEKVYGKFGGSDIDLDRLSKDPVLASLSQEIEGLRNQLAIIEAEATEEEPLPLIEQSLAQAGLIFQHVTIPDQFPWIGKELREWRLPTEMRILSVRKKNGFEIANGKTVVEAHDQITFIGPKRKSQTYRYFWIDR